MKCPACRKEVPDGSRACPFCPESFDYEDDDERPRQKFRRIDPGSWPIHYWLFFFVVVGFGIWRVLAVVLLLGEDGMRNPLKKFIDRRGDIMAQPAPNLLNEGMNIVLGSAPPAGLADARAMRKSIKGDDTPPETATEGWRLSGNVYDLVTLQPIGGCVMVFSARGYRFETTTNETGGYALAVSALEHGGYKAVLKHSGYAKTYLNPSTEHVPQMSAEDRRGLAQDLAASNEGPFEVQAIAGSPLVTDFYLAPEKP